MTDALDRKILSIDAMTRERQVLRDAGRSVVQCHGCFDIVHPGHIRYLRFARQLGDALIVSLTGDSQIAKGPNRPYIPQDLRAENLAALEFVDYVVIDANPTARELLTRLRPDVYVKGREYANAGDPRFEQERDIVESYGGRVVFHSGDIVFSSSRLIRSMDADASLEECRLRSMLAQAGVTRGGLENTLNELGGLRAIVIGDALREQTVICDAGAAAADAPALLLQQLESNAYWTGAAAIAAQLRAFDVQTRLITVANDSDIESMRGELADVAVDAVRNDAACRGRTLFIADDTRLFELHHGAPSAIDSAVQHRLIERVEPLLDQCDLLIFCDAGGGLLSRSLVERLSARRREARPFIAGCAQGPKGDLTTMSGVNLIFAPERRLREAVHDMTSSLPAACWNLLSQTRVGAAVVSLHKRGLISFFGDTRGAGNADGSANRLQSAYIPNLCDAPLDLLGADETAFSIAAAALAARADHASATYLATAAHGLAARRAGRAMITTSDLSRWLANRAELRPDSRFMPDSATLGDIARLAPPLAETAR
ncbi:MAG: adenylyltransferase/cytidyltransferase family protein [Phycisphaerales bacterium]|nr:adenylyltransferase/cytidyltransferase family protein [Phycisphaerales bacterium]